VAVAVATTVFSPAVVYVCFTDVPVDPRSADRPSPKSTWMFWTATPVGAPGIVAEIVNVTAVFALGLSLSAVMPTEGLEFVTVMLVVLVEPSPKASDPVTVTRYEPTLPYACEMTPGWPVKFWVCPSPQFTVTRVMGLEPAAVPYVSGNDTAWPTPGLAGAGVPIVNDAVALTVTVTDAFGAAVVVVPEEDVTPAVAVTFAVLEVVRLVRATPAVSVVDTDDVTVPASVVNVTGTPPSGLPLESLTVADTVDVPPLDGNDSGDALRTMLLTAAAPTAIFTAPVVPADTPPEIAVMVAVPEAPLAENVAEARPLMSVSTSAGWMVPSVVVKLTSVPEWGGVPDGSITCATIVVDPFAASDVACEVSVIVEPEGASSGTF
jgi:hypothetical protein